jgi:hypothetical protein
MSARVPSARAAHSPSTTTCASAEIGPCQRQLRSSCTFREQPSPATTTCGKPGHEHRRVLVPALSVGSSAFHSLTAFAIVRSFCWLHSVMRAFGVVLALVAQRERQYTSCLNGCQLLQSLAQPWSRIAQREAAWWHTQRGAPGAATLIDRTLTVLVTLSAHIQNCSFTYELVQH